MSHFVCFYSYSYIHFCNIIFKSCKFPEFAELVDFIWDKTVYLSWSQHNFKKFE